MEYRQAHKKNEANFLIIDGSIIGQGKKIFSHLFLSLPGIGKAAVTAWRGRMRQARKKTGKRKFKKSRALKPT